MPRYDVTGIGTAACDYRVRVARLPGADEKVRAPELKIVGGGTVGTALVTLARLGFRTAWAGVLGDDAFGAWILADLQQEGVNTAAVKVAPGARSPFAFCAANAEHRAVISVAATTPSLALAPGDADRLLDATFLHMDGKEPQAALALARAAKARGTRVSLDLQRVEPESAELLLLAEVAVVSESFAREHAPGRPPEEVAEALFRPGMLLAAVTLGRRGAAARDGEGPFHVPAEPVEASGMVDSTGAGDAYHGALLAGLVHGHDPRRALQLAAHVAARSCRALGRDSLPLRAELAGWW